MSDKDIVNMWKDGGRIIVSIDDELAYENAKVIAAELGRGSERGLADIAAGLARKEVVSELKKTGAFNPGVESTVVLESELPIEI